MRIKDLVYSPNVHFHSEGQAGPAAVSILWRALFNLELVGSGGTLVYIRYNVIRLDGRRGGEEYRCSRHSPPPPGCSSCGPVGELQYPMGAPGTGSFT